MRSSPNSRFVVVLMMVMYMLIFWVCLCGSSVVAGLMHASCTHCCLYSNQESGYIVSLDVSLLSLCGCFGDALCTIPPTHFCLVSNCCNVHVDIVGVSLCGSSVVALGRAHARFLHSLLLVFQTRLDIVSLDVSLLFLCCCFAEGLCTLPPSHFCLKELFHVHIL